ncbi:hypothetical protein HanRHA438_Chr02g0065731 [Helianthus annuus]|nr:hypothetical protein HanRHA438_Chr02g0065731 [Helianthus annuus]
MGNRRKVGDLIYQVAAAQHPVDQVYCNSKKMEFQRIKSEFLRSNYIFFILISIGNGFVFC